MSLVSKPPHSLKSRNALPPSLRWGVYLPFFLEAVSYAGTLVLLSIFLSQNAGIGDVGAGLVVAAFTAGITACAIVLGGLGDRSEPGIAFAAALLLILFGRMLLPLADTLGLPNGAAGRDITVALDVAALMLVVLGYGFFQPAAYAAVRRGSDAQTAALAYAALAALENLAAFAAGVFESAKAAITVAASQMSRLFPTNLRQAARAAARLHGLLVSATGC